MRSVARSFILVASIWRPKVITSSSCPPAAVYGRRVIGIVLSSMEDDGTAGLKAIHREGGICIVQSPSDATARGMPTSALLSNHTDFCVLLDEMPKLLMSLVSPTGRAG